MRIIISDANRIWTPDHPALKPFAEIIIVVCMNGQPVTDKYQCFVTELRAAGLGMSWGENSAKYRALEAKADELVRMLRYHDDIVFLTDGEPESLYPFMVIREKDEWNYLHLVSMSPWRFETKRRMKYHKAALTDLSEVSSLLWMNGDSIIREIDPKSTLPDLYKETQRRFGDLLPRILYQIQERDWDRAYFDFNSMCYLPVEDGGNLTDDALAAQEIDSSKIEAFVQYTTMGKIAINEYPNRDEWTLEEVEALIPRIDGKKICNYLRELRMQLADANNIEFESPECPSIGPCAGTCAKCEAEAAYLQAEMEKIVMDKRVYPQELLTEWEVF